MKKIFIILSSVIFLTACNSTTQPVENIKTVADGDTVKMYYTLRDTDENGSIIDTNIGTGGILEPEKVLKTVIGTQSLIPGFEKSIIGMKENEEKTFTVAPADGYGESTITQDVPYFHVAPIYTETLPKNILSWRVQETQQKSDIPTEILTKLEKEHKAGDIIEESEWRAIKLISINETEIVFEVIQKNNPFLDKELTVGLEGTINDQEVKILEINWYDVKIEITNKLSPFYGKDFSIGAKAETESGIFEILDIKENQGEKVVTLKLPNLTHPLAGKTLHFTVKITEIEKKKEDSEVKETKNKDEVEFEIPKEEKAEVETTEMKESIENSDK